MLRTLVLMTAAAVLVGASPPLPQPSSTGQFGPQVGVGSVQWKDDFTDAAFDLTRYLELNPLMLKGQKARAFLVDFPTDAEWYVSGALQGSTYIDTKNETFEGQVGGSFTIRRKGKKVATFVIAPTRISRSVGKTPISRRELLEPLWKAVAARLKTEVEATP